MEHHKSIFSDLGSRGCHHRERCRRGDADRCRARRSRGSTWRKRRKHCAAPRGPLHLHSTASNTGALCAREPHIALGCQPHQVAWPTRQVCCGDAPDASCPLRNRSRAPRAPCARSVLAVGSRERREGHAGGAAIMMSNVLAAPRHLQEPDSYLWSGGRPLLAACGCHGMPCFMSQ